MPKSALTGTRIRERRLSLRLKQADLARDAGISASYLNLIEHNRRRIGGKLLVGLATALDVELAALTEGADAQMLEGLQAVADQPSDQTVEIDRVEEFVGRFPGWAGRLTEQNQRIATLERTLQGLNDRLTHDPVLTEKMHDVLGAVAAIRSTSSILVGTPDIDADWRHRFHTNIDTESRRLAETSAAMAAHFDRLARDDTGFTTPLEAVSAFFETRDFHVAEIEETGRDAIKGLLATAPELAAAPAKEMARDILELYASDAAAMPFDPFSESAQKCGYDPALLARQFKLSLASVFRRLATLPRQVDSPEIGLVTCDAAGAILLRKPPTGFSLPRFGAACPLWPLFAALRSPGTPIRQNVLSSEGVGFVAYAVAGTANSLDFDGPQVVRATMLLIGTPDPAPDALPVGSTCRVCPRADCPARREPSILTQS